MTLVMVTKDSTRINRHQHNAGDLREQKTHGLVG